MVFCCGLPGAWPPGICPGVWGPGKPGPGDQARADTLCIRWTGHLTLFSGPLAEEAGWRGFALPRLQTKYKALVSSLILGVIWCCWHLPLYFLPGSSQQGIPFPIYLALVVTLGIYFTWLYNNTRGSLIITVLAHFSFNLSGGFIAGTLGLLPPMVLYIAAGSMLVLTTIGVILYFGPKTLSRKPAGELPVQPGFLPTVPVQDSP